MANRFVRQRRRRSCGVRLVTEHDFLYMYIFIFTQITISTFTLSLSFSVHSSYRSSRLHSRASTRTSRKTVVYKRILQTTAITICLICEHSIRRLRHVAAACKELGKSETRIMQIRSHRCR